jgi:hypothetical protein
MNNLILVINYSFVLIMLVILLTFEIHNKLTANKNLGS